MTFKTDAFVLKIKPWREADRLYYLFTPHEGMLQVVAKSAASSSSKMAGHLPSFGKTRVMIGRGKQDHLAGAQLIKDHASLRTDLRSMSLAASIAEIFLSELSTGIKWQEYELLEDIFSLLDDNTTPHDKKLVLVRAFLWKFLSIAGWQPQLDYCVVCNKEITEGNYLPGRGIICFDHQQATTLSMSQNLLQFLREIITRPLVDVLEQDISKDLNKEWLQASQAYYQEVYDRPSKALKLFVYG